ncbi:MAG: RNA polymerase sigma factor [Vicinamibacterales bacterium]|nr:RNA polymerase sigma factor [Vicinamibacterales bacterium]MDP6608958.1 RNA polymerase sigma factor [Vicinamibacterales bacterium]
MRGTTTFGDLIDAHQAELMRYLVRLSGNRADADDLFQETFLRAFRAFRRLRARSNHRAWLYRIATNVFLNHRRAAGRRRETSLGRDFEAWFGSTAQSDAVASLTLRRVVEALSRRQRSAFLQRNLQGRSYTDIGASLGCSATTARAHVYQAAKRVRRALTPRGGQS